MGRRLSEENRASLTADWRGALLEAAQTPGAVQQRRDRFRTALGWTGELPQPMTKRLRTGLAALESAIDADHAGDTTQSGYPKLDAWIARHLLVADGELLASEAVRLGRLAHIRHKRRRRSQASGGIRLSTIEMPEHLWIALAGLRKERGLQTLGQTVAALVEGAVKTTKKPSKAT